MIKSLLDPTFRYTSAADTDIRRLFAKELRRIADERREQQMRAFNVTPIKDKVKA